MDTGPESGSTEVQFRLIDKMMIIDLFNLIYVKRAIIFLLRYNDPSDAPVGLFPHHLLRRKEMVLLFISVFPPPPNLTRLLDIHRATCPRSKSLTLLPFTVLPNTCKEIGQTKHGPGTNPIHYIH